MSTQQCYYAALRGIVLSSPAYTHPTGDNQHEVILAFETVPRHFVCIHCQYLPSNNCSREPVSKEKRVRKKNKQIWLKPLLCRRENLLKDPWRILICKLKEEEKRKEGKKGKELLNLKVYVGCYLHIKKKNFVIIRKSQHLEVKCHQQCEFLVLQPRVQISPYYELHLNFKVTMWFWNLTV